MSTEQAQQAWQSNSEFAGDGDVLEEGDIRSGDQTGITAVNKFQGVLADPNCSGIEILSAVFVAAVSNTHDGTNHHLVSVRLVDAAGSVIDSISVDTDSFSNITAANSPVRINIPVKTLFFTAQTERIQLRYEETGTAPITAPSVFIRYRKVFGNNPVVSNATLAVV